MKYQLTPKQQRIIDNSRKNYSNDEDFADYKKDVLRALSRKPIQKRLKNSGMMLVVRYVIDYDGFDGYLGLECSLHSLNGKILWKGSMYYDENCVSGMLDGRETKSWLISEAKDMLYNDICDIDGERIINKLLD